MKTSEPLEPGGGAPERWTLEGAGGLLEAAEETLRPGGLGLTEYALGCCNFPDGSRILDAGCGTAATARYLVNAGRLVAVGVDRSPTLLAEGRRQCPELPLVCADLERLPFAGASFDGVICECVLSQTDAGQVLPGFRRVLRPGGYLIATDLYRKAEKPAEGSADSLATREQTLDQLEAAGFETLIWEDRTVDLRRLAFNLIMAPGSSRDNLLGWSRHRGCSDRAAACEWWRGVGYQLIVARSSEL